MAQERGLPRPRVETAGLTLISVALASNRQPLSKLAALEGRAPARWHDFRQAGQAGCLSYVRRAFRALPLRACDRNSDLVFSAPMVHKFLRTIPASATFNNPEVRKTRFRQTRRCDDADNPDVRQTLYLAVALFVQR